MGNPPQLGRGPPRLVTVALILTAAQETLLEERAPAAAQPPKGDFTTSRFPEH